MQTTMNPDTKIEACMRNRCTGAKSVDLNGQDSNIALKMDNLMINTDEAFEVDAFDASALGKKRVTPPAIKKSRRVAHQTPKLTKSLPKPLPKKQPATTVNNNGSAIKSDTRLQAIDVNRLKLKRSRPEENVRPSQPQPSISQSLATENQANTASEDKNTGLLFREFLIGSDGGSTNYAHKTPTFHPFPRLPVELRLKIWRRARPEPRIVKLERKLSGQGVYSTTPIPGIMRACKESREYGLQHWYTLNSECSQHRRPIAFYFDPTHDFLFTGCAMCDISLLCMECYVKWPQYAYTVATRLMIGCPGGIDLNAFIILAISYPAVKELVILKPDFPTGLLPTAPLQYSDLASSSHCFDWQRGKSLKEAYTVAAEKWKQRGYPWEHNLEKLTCMELAITPKTSKLYGFLKYQFEDLEIRTLLQTPIPGISPDEGRKQDSKNERKSNLKKKTIVQRRKEQRVIEKEKARVEKFKKVRVFDPTVIIIKDFMVWGKLGVVQAVEGHIMNLADHKD